MPMPKKNVPAAPGEDNPIPKAGKHPGKQSATTPADPGNKPKTPATPTPFKGKTKK